MTHLLLFPLRIKTLLSLALCASLASADSTSPCCNYNLFPPIKQNNPVEPEAVQVTSDHVNGTGKQYIFTGDVVISTPQQTIRAEEVSYSPQSKQSYSEGKVKYQNQLMQFTAHKVAHNNKNKKTHIDNSRYSLLNQQLNGRAKRADLLSKVHTQIEHSTLSTCPVDSKVQDWDFSAEHIDMNHVDGWARAKKVRFRIQGHPILYLPFVDFPLDARRKTGLLYPSVSQSSRTGVALNLPWYWNIHRNMDLLSDLYLIEKQGLWVSERLRYLSPYSYTVLNLEGIDTDRLKDDQTRFFYRLNHQGAIYNPRLTYDIDYSHASDTDFFTDFESTVFGSDQKYLDQVANIRYTEDTWQLEAKAQAFQSLTDNTEKYRLLPQINFNWRPNAYHGLQLSIHGQYSHFKHQTIDKVQGKRSIANLDVRRPFSNSYLSVTPGIHHIQRDYSKLQNTTVSQMQNHATTYYLDNKLFLERDLNMGNTAWLQTLTPRLYYARRKAGENEADLPDFDTSNRSFTYHSLFDHALYTGQDRSGELDRISLGVESKFINRNNNKTAVSLKIGQGYHFDSKTKTNLAANVTLDHAPFHANLALHFAPDSFDTVKATSDIHYKLNDKKRIRLSYKSKPESYKTLVLAGRWQTKPMWQLFGKLEHDIQKAYSKEQILGLAYQNCCWELMLSYQRSAKNTDDGGEIDYDNKLKLTFALRGLSRQTIDRKIDDTIE